MNISNESIKEKTKKAIQTKYNLGIENIDIYPGNKVIVGVYTRPDQKTDIKIREIDPETLEAIEKHNTLTKFFEIDKHFNYISLKPELHCDLLAKDNLITMFIFYDEKLIVITIFNL